MLHRLYNPWHITNEGERTADRQLILPAGYEEELFHIIYRLRLASRFHRVQMAGECDFVILCKQGIMVMEVKGGMIGCGEDDQGDRGFYRLTGEENKEPIKNPFTQADGNADAVRKFLYEKGVRNVFVGKMVCFPECACEVEGIGVEYLWHRGLKKKLLAAVSENLELQITEFRRKQEKRNVPEPIQWKILDEAEIHHIADLLRPEFEPDRYRTRALLNREESIRREAEGIHVLSGLDENRRIMVQGPPGSGKTTYAFNIISRLCLKEVKTGLYLCWNELLAAEMKKKVSGMCPDTDDPPIHVAPLFHYARELADMLGDPSLKPTIENVSRGEMRSIVQNCISGLHNRKIVPKYDFIIADEAQDLFDKGLDLIIKYMLKDSNALQKGNYYAFYDDRQAFPGTEEHNPIYIRTRDTLKESSAYYMLFSNLRVNTGHGLEQLILDAGNGTADSRKDYGEDVRFMTYKNPEEAISMIHRCIDQEVLISKVDPNEIMVLLASDLFKENSPIRSSLSSNPDFELVIQANYAQPPNRIRYTSILSSKGMEWETVILIFSSMNDAKFQHQLFVGASRAKGRVYLTHNPYKNSDP